MKNCGNANNKVTNFVAALKSLPCIPNLTGTLCTIGSFYDHNEKIFQIFCDESCFLPNRFRDSQWHGFFQKFGLKTVPTYEEFVLCCKRLPNLCDVSVITTGSEALLGILFDVSDAGTKNTKTLSYQGICKKSHKFPLPLLKNYLTWIALKSRKWEK